MCYTTQKHRAGYTLVEVLVVISVFLLMLTMTLPFLGSFYRNQNAGAYCKRVRQSVYRAAYKSIAGEHSTPWGVHMNAGSYLLFAGQSFASRITPLDEIVDIPNTMSFTGLPEVIFTKYSGLPKSTGTISIVLNGETTDCVTLVESGLIE
jgi:prepilin-type N-terminal cleavage/methylation domain-containing protein